MKVILLSYTQNPEDIIEVAAKTCYSPGTVEQKWAEEADSIKQKKFIEKLREMGHLSPFEHVNFTFGIDGISRTCSHQLVRHRIASFSQQSQRYVTYDAGKKDLEEFFETPDAILTGADDVFYTYVDALDVICDAYENLVTNLQKSGLSKTEATEIARYILPNSMKTNLVMTMKARELMHFFALRCCNRAQDEIRQLAWNMLYLLQERFPSIFAACGPKCLTDKCKEGKMGCGKPYQSPML